MRSISLLIALVACLAIHTVIAQQQQQAPPVITFYTSTLNCSDVATQIANYTFTPSGECINFPAANASGILTNTNEVTNLYVDAIFLGLDCIEANTFLEASTFAGDQCQASGQPWSMPNQPWTYSIEIDITAPYTLSTYDQSDLCERSEESSHSGIAPNLCLADGGFWMSPTSGDSGYTYFYLTVNESATPVTFNLSYYLDANCTQNGGDGASGDIGVCAKDINPEATASYLVTETAGALPSTYRHIIKDNSQKQHARIHAQKMHRAARRHHQTPRRSMKKAHRSVRLH